MLKIGTCLDVYRGSPFWIHYRLVERLVLKSLKKWMVTYLFSAASSQKPTINQNGESIITY
jgi:hypothetical protein